MARILVPVDGSASALRALRHAAALAARGRAELHLLHVLPPMPLYGVVPATMHASQYHAACEALAQKALAPALRLVRRMRAAHRVHVVYGDPAASIAERARRLKCGSIVMGTRGLGAVGSLVLGSVATKVIHLAGAPVTLVK